MEPSRIVTEDGLGERGRDRVVLARSMRIWWLPLLATVVLMYSCESPSGSGSDVGERRAEGRDESALSADAAAGRGSSPIIAEGRVIVAKRMTVPRAAHTTTPLPDGRVLVVGGCTLEGCEMADEGATAELYDPFARSFAETGSMTTERVSHTATPLLNGKVLVVGGWDSDGVLSSAELYDPATSAFSPAGDMSTGRAAHTASLLPDGRVLLAGGYDGDRSLADAEIYDPGTESFRRTGDMETPRSAHAAALLADGRVLLTGGSDSRENVVASAEIYDPGEGEFIRTGDMAAARHKHAAAALEDGRVLVLGGSDADDFYDKHASAEVFDPETDTFTAAPGMSMERFKLPDAVAALDRGEVLVGGDGEHAEIYSPGSEGFRVVRGNMETARMFATATPLTNGAALIAGGYDQDINPTSKTWLYVPEDREAPTANP